MGNDGTACNHERLQHAKHGVRLSQNLKADPGLCLLLLAAFYSVRHLIVEELCVTIYLRDRKCSRELSALYLVSSPNKAPAKGK